MNDALRSLSRSFDTADLEERTQQLLATLTPYLGAESEATEAEAWEAALRLQDSIYAKPSRAGARALKILAETYEMAADRLGPNASNFHDEAADYLTRSSAMLTTYIDGIVSGFVAGQQLAPFRRPILERHTEFLADAEHHIVGKIEREFKP